MPLTDIACKNAKPTDKPYKLADGGGLHLLVKPGGGRYWRMKYRFDGKEKVLAFGVYPEVSLAQAREKRDQARAHLAKDIDPAEARRKLQQADQLNRQNSFEAIAREWHENRKGAVTERYAENVLRRLELDIFPVIGRRPIADIEAPELLEAARKIEKRGAHELARRSMQVCGQVFRYAIATGRAKRNPAPDLKEALKPVKAGHFAALDIKEFPAFLRALERNDARLYPLTRLAIRLMMLTFVRTTELIEAPWAEIDFEAAQWVIPGARMKRDKDHIVPLSRQAIAVLEELRALTGQRKLIFPNQARPDKPMSNNTILFALGRLGYKGRMTGHGFRALAMSAIKEKLGYRHEVVDRQLAHVHRNKVDAAYDRAKFLDERTVMMQDWADYVDQLSGDNVIPLPQAQRHA